MTEKELPIGFKALDALMEHNYSADTIDNLMFMSRVIPKPLKLYKEIIEFVEQDPTERELWDWTQEKMDEYLPRERQEEK